MSISISKRLRIAAWALLNAERLHALQFSMLRDHRAHGDRLDAEHARQECNVALYGRPGAIDAHGEGYNEGRIAAAHLYAHQLQDMPGTAANKAAL